MDLVQHALIVIGVISIVCYLIFTLVRSVLIRRALTAVVTMVLTSIYWAFAPDAAVDPIFIGHVVSGILFFNSLGKLMSLQDKLSGNKATGKK